MPSSFVLQDSVLFRGGLYWACTIAFSCAFAAPFSAQAQNTLRLLIPFSSAELAAGRVALMARIDVTAMWIFIKMTPTFLARFGRSKLLHDAVASAVEWILVHKYNVLPMLPILTSSLLYVRQILLISGPGRSRCASIKPFRSLLHLIKRIAPSTPYLLGIELDLVPKLLAA